ncbi:uncharacterized protein HMF8227_01596 [Saliniradius amylolyticus]|uniref:Inner membrane protein YejM N-terminal domain-containing protein n=1 Tax=Saliniradius amylolyticus TaxID=2183582 RepID=A0A2S2E498_9ALTE|nr:DUF3413 domain-containing protein [Saliniradius amylolyticus]AWL12070.1 uncharacterized protein HMF8227_01596 [Saliniradius amylolyticus]
MILGETPRRQRVARLVSWGHWFALANILIAIVIASVYVFNSRAPDTALGVVYLLSNWFSHIAFLTFIGFIILVLPFCYLLPNARLVRATGSVFAALGLALLAFDALLYNKHGIHLSLSSADIIRSETQGALASLSWQQWGFLVLLFVVWFLFQLMVANAIYKRIERLQKQRISLPVVSFFVACFVISHGGHIWADAKLYDPILQQDDMFPLSYPATAKTLMSKYGLLDLQSYQRRKELQLDTSFQQVNYPLRPVYCAVNTKARVVVLVREQSQFLPLLDTLEGLTPQTDHFDIASSRSDSRFSVLYGLPALYQQAIAERHPVPFDITHNLGLPTRIYSDGDLPDGVDNFRRDWNTFERAVNSDEAMLAIGFVDDVELSSLLNSTLLSNSQVIITSTAPGKGAPLYTNIPGFSQQVSSHEDLLPTVMDVLECGADKNLFSTGQSLISPERQWLISNHGNTLVLLDNQSRVEVDSKGNHLIFPLGKEQSTNQDLNVSRLSQAIKHLSRFTR